MDKLISSWIIKLKFQLEINLFELNHGFDPSQLKLDVPLVIFLSYIVFSKLILRSYNDTSASIDNNIVWSQFNEVSCFLFFVIEAEIELSIVQLEYAALDAAVLIHIFRHVGDHSQPSNVSEGHDKFEWKSYIVSIDVKSSIQKT